ncbi:MAG TPA: bacteriohopanetetrol glucosamine biosynthesis glycosyltransferase HpnI [Candidatus Limnocylindrales bacterium]|nr:bacteriohopanetetrol glucosamine biosynthesis glycosyltransferase HpnI [Candidatus Limnocylindrales bacterium]
MIWWALPALAAAAYYLLALIAAARWPRKAAVSAPPVSGISILKPVHGRDPRFYEAIRSHAAQDFPVFEILFGVSSPADPAIQDIDRLRAEFPHIPISLHIVRTTAPNAKAGVLGELARHAQHGILLVNDSDILVEPGYLREVTEPLAEASVGLVTCIYRATADSWPSRMEALGIATEFAPSVLVARLLGVAEFALGSTMAFRAAVLAEIGGFAAIQEYLADDYQLGRHISAHGYKIRFAASVVETSLGAQTWPATWRHQLRWSRTIRVSRFSGYCGYVVTHATLWGLVALAAGQWPAAVAAIGLRMAAGIWVAGPILRDWRSAGAWPLIPFRDLFGFAVWAAGLAGNTVDWRGQKLLLQADGKIRTA